PGRAVGQRTAGSGVPVEFEGAVHRDEDVTYRLSVIHDDDTPDVSGAADQALAEAHDLDPARHVARPLAGAILAGQLTDAGVYPEVCERLDHDAGHRLESLPDPGPGLWFGHRPGEGQGLLVEDSRSSSRPTVHLRQSVG